MLRKLSCDERRNMKYVSMFISPEWINNVSYQQVTNPVAGISILIARSQTIHNFDDMSSELLLWIIILSFTLSWKCSRCVSFPFIKCDVYWYKRFNSILSPFCKLKQSKYTIIFVLCKYIIKYKYFQSFLHKYSLHKMFKLYKVFLYLPKKFRNFSRSTCMWKMNFPIYNI